MDLVLGSSANIASEASRSIFKAIKRHVKYVIMYQENVDRYKQKLETLKAKRRGVQQEIDMAMMNVEKIKADVEHWCQKVDEAFYEEEYIVKRLEELAKKRCFIGFCPNIKFRYRLSRKAKDDAYMFDELLMVSNFDRVSYRDVPTASQLESLDVSSGDLEGLDSRKMICEKIITALKDDTIDIIGVHGMAGVGKTTLINEVARQVHMTRLFSCVVFVTVTQNGSIYQIQEEIAESLDVDLKLLADGPMEERMLRLRNRLEGEEKILLVLDDIWWGRLDLSEVGIPVWDQHKGCKILLTSRSQDVLRQMDAVQVFEVGVLEEDESWQLFKKMVGQRVEGTELHPIAIEIVKKCEGLPVVIATIAKALRYKSLPHWKSALSKLQAPSSTNIDQEPSSNLVTSTIQLSYDHLDSEELKQTFLLCSLLGHDASVECLLRYSIALGLKSNAKPKTVEEARNYVLAMINKLKDSSLLRDSYSNELFDMHDLVYDFALATASRDNQVFALRDGDVLIEWPKEEIMRKCTHISLSFAAISRLPDELKCPQLTLFYMGSSNPSTSLPPNFFKETINLKVLDLSRMHLSPLPSSISFLKNLQTLSLDQCILGNMSIIGELRSLQILSLSMSDIKMLPKEVGKLSGLRVLDLNHCTKLRTIPPGVLSSLSRLEELYMGNSFVQWEANQGGANQRSNASLDEVKALSCLTALHIHILDAKIIPKDFFSERWQRYKIYIGEAWSWDDKEEYQRTLKVQLIRTSIDHHLDHAVRLLLQKTEAFYLRDLEGIKILSNEFGNREGFLQLKNLHIRDAWGMQYIMVNNNDTTDKTVFHQLESLILETLPQLISFSQKNRSGGSTSIPQHELPLFDEQVVFPCLKKLRLSSINVEKIWHNNQLPQTLTSLIIQDCGNLKRLLSFSMATSLVQLKYFEISECRNLREIIFEEDMVNAKDDTISFPQLSSLKIRDLQQLTGFCSNHHSIKFPCLKLLEIEHCPMLKGFVMYKSTEEENQQSKGTLFDDKVAFPSLEEMTISQLRNLKMIWHDQHSPDSFHELKRLKVEGCYELLTIFPSNSLKIFERLQLLMVSNCGSLETIFKEAGSSNMQLRELRIFNLPKLKYIWIKDPKEASTSFDNLSVVHVWDCWSLRNVFPATIARDLRKLKDLKIESCGVEEIISKAESSEMAIAFSFDQGISLVLRNLPKLKCFYPGRHTTCWPGLKKLDMHHCNKEKIHYIEHPGDSIQQPLFGFEMAIPGLEELSLNGDEIGMISNNQMSIASLFYKIKVLKMRCYHDESAIFPLSFLQKFNDLEELEVTCCNFKELFPGEGHIVEAEICEMLPKIRFLKVSDLHNLTHIWNQGINEILPNLETIEVRNCGSLISCGPSFESITSLEIWECQNIVNIFTNSTSPQYLVHLTKMRIGDCNRLTEIFENIEGEAQRNIVLPRLKYLELHCLQSLTSFYSGKDTFLFPSLEQVIVRQCPNMKTFCSGDLITPILSRVRQTEDDQEGCWFGSLNATIPHLYMKDQKVAYQGIEHLELSRFPELMETWNKMSQEIINFKILKHLEIYNSSNLRHIFSPSMAMELVHLEKLEIIGCILLEEVVITSGSSEEDRRLNKKLFPRLVFLRLIALPLLTRFCSGDYFEFTYLKRLWVEKCPLLGTFIERMLPKGNIEETNLGNNLQADNQALFDKKVGFLSLEKLVIIDMENLKRVSSDQISVDSFCRPKVLKLLGVAKQSTILPPCSPHLISNLQELVVGRTNELRELFQCEGAPGEIIKHGWAQARFSKLSLFKLPMLTHIWKEGFRFQQPGELFQNLITLEVSECSALKILVPSPVSLTNLTTLEIVECHGFLNLITPSTAKSMAQLQTLKITHCNLISEIVAPSGGGGVEEYGIISFLKLMYIGLQFLPSLTSFCSGPYTFDFPALDKLIVRGCPKLEKFSMPDDLKPQNLEKVCLSEEEDDWHWVRADNLNTTIKELYTAQKSSNHLVKELGIEQWSLENFW